MSDDVHFNAVGVTTAEDAAAQRVDALFELDRWADVVQHAAPLLAQAPDPKLFAQVLHAHWALGDLRAMQRTLALARQRWPADERFFFYAAQLALARSLFMQAEREARAGLAVVPQHAGLHFALAQVLWHKGDAPGARQAVEQALALEPSKALYHHLLAALVADQDLAQALHYNSEALALEPNNADHLALQASLRSGQNRAVAADLLRSSLRVNPTSHTRQQRLRELTALWWLDLALVLGSVALTVAATWWTGRPAWLFGLACAVFAVLGVAMMGRLSRLPLLVALCGLQALAGMSDAPTGLPQRLLRDGWSALWQWDTLAFVAGSVLVAGLLWVLLALLRVAFWNALVRVGEFARDAALAMREVGPLAYGADLLRRPGVRYNLLGATLVAATVLPPMALPTGMLLQVFVLPAVLWALGRWLLPRGTAPLPSVLFMLLCFGLMLGTVLFVAVSHFDVERPDAVLQAAWALVVWLYALALLNNLRQM